MKSLKHCKWDNVLINGANKNEIFEAIFLPNHFICARKGIDLKKIAFEFTLKETFHNRMHTDDTHASTLALFMFEPIIIK